MQYGEAWSTNTIPGAATLATVLGPNLFSDAMRDVKEVAPFV